MRWIINPETGGTAQIPDDALPTWRQRGWELGEAPEQANPVLDPDHAPETGGTAQIPDDAAEGAAEETANALVANDIEEG